MLLTSPLSGDLICRPVGEGNETWLKVNSTFLRKATLDPGHPSPRRVKTGQLLLIGNSSPIISYWGGSNGRPGRRPQFKQQLSFLDSRGRVNRAQVGPWRSDPWQDHLKDSLIEHSKIIQPPPSPAQVTPCQESCLSGDL